MYVGDICKRSVDTTELGEGVQAAARRMHQRNVGSLVVLDGERNVTGIVTDRDLTLRVIAQGLDPAQTSVADVMTPQVACVRVRDPLESAVNLMRSKSCRRLPVLDSSDRLVGVVSLDDLLLHYESQLRGVSRLLEAESPASVASV